MTLFEHPESLRIYGPAGAGKTRELVEILQEHVEDGDFHLAEGIIISFTRAAAHDIARRVAPDSAPGRYHCTIHALCKRYYGFESELAEKHVKTFFKERLIDYRPGVSPDPEDWVSVVGEQRSEGALLMAFWNLCRNRMISLAEGRQMYRPDPEVQRWWVGPAMDRLYQEYQQWKTENRYIDFTDMLEYSLQSPPRSHWPFLALDEAQDCTPLQWAVVQAFANCADVVYLAGDDDQAIYSWAGATPSEFLHARVSTTDVLRINHRSGGVIVNEAQEFIRRNRERQEKNIVATNEGGQIARLVDGEMPVIDLNEKTFVMARAHFLNEPILDELTRQGVPFVDRRGSFGVAGKASAAYQRFLRLSKGHAISLDEWRLLIEAIPSDGRWLVRGSKTLLARLPKREREDTLVRLRDVVEHGATEELQRAIGAADVEVLARLDQQRLGYLREVERRYGPEFLEPAKAGEICQVGSIHGFKGLEADHAIIHGGIPTRALKEAMRDPEPERRVMYVAMTRAKRQITHYTSGPTTSKWERVL